MSLSFDILCYDDVKAPNRQLKKRCPNTLLARELEHMASSMK